MKKQKNNILIVIIASLIIMYFILKDDFSNISAVIASANIWWLILGAGMLFIYWFFQTICLLTVSNATSEKISFKNLFKSTIVCNFFSAITPSATGGQPFQIYYLNKKGVKLGEATNLVVEQTTLYQIALVLMGLIAIILNFFFDFFPSDNFLKKLVLIGFLVNTAVIVILSYISFGKKSNKSIALKIVRFLHKIKIIRNEEKSLEKVEKVVDSFYVSATTLNKNKFALVKGVVFNFIGLAFLYSVPLMVAYSLGNYTDLNLLITIVSAAYVMLIGTFVPIPGGSGGIEYAFAAFFGFYIIGPTLMAMLLLWRFLTYYLPILIGGIVIISERDGGI
ncbi:MAG: lysylphosphatidylglycerol synthase transmembrane domain-containing protein [Bacilli bacterium]|nr:lysylphosphatidylglycerol synthase transmembrane domain-containing protein [Bacilli bacterium]MDD4411883.1 lysylphosphatidylglycerol synthase transmembrane domain-containing protein [Bacilli bacterium]